MTKNVCQQLYRPAPQTRTIAPTAILLELDGLGLASGISYAMLMTRTAFHLARVEDGTIRTRAGPAALSDCYEVRLFGPETDARWQRTGADEGRLSILTVQPPTGDHSPEPTHILKRRYRLWGKTSGGAQDGWCVLKTARVSPIAVPVEAPPDVALQFDAVEHVARRAHGNAVVVGERLRGISIAEDAE